MRYGVEGGSNGEGGGLRRDAIVLESIKSQDGHLMILHIKVEINGKLAITAMSW